MQMPDDFHRTIE